MYSITQILLYTFIVKVSSEEYGLLYGRKSGDNNWPVEICITYNPEFFPLPSVEKDAFYGKLKDFTPDYGCHGSNVYKGGEGQDKIVAVTRGNCTFVEKTDMAQQHGSKGILIVSDTFVNPALNQSSDRGRFHIPSAVVMSSNFIQLQDLGNDTELKIYAPPIKESFDPCLVVIFLLSVFCVSVGGYWSGLTVSDRRKRKEEKNQKKTQTSQYTSSDTETDESKKEKEDEEENLDITLPSVIIFFVLVCVFLVLLYFFYDYLVFVIISLFCIAGSLGLYYCIHPLWSCIPIETRTPKSPCCKKPPEVKNIVLYLLCATVAIVWAIQRHESYAWVLQDILGVAFCINMLKTIQIPNLKVCSILLILLFLYDIFFVFITPYFTKNGESIMVKVATGGSSKSQERLPMVFIVPRLFSPYSSCLNQPSMLGFGDVIVPGLLIGYNHGIDLRVNSRKVYYIATVIGYAVGMIITFVALETMKTGQPALLYLVPCTLVTTFVIGLIRGELKLLWFGDKKESSNNEESSRSTRGPDQASVGQVDLDIASNASSNSTIDSENKSLIRK